MLHPMRNMPLMLPLIQPLPRPLAKEDVTRVAVLFMINSICHCSSSDINRYYLCVHAAVASASFIKTENSDLR